MVRSLLREANDRVVRLWDGGEQREEKSCRLSDRQRRRWTDNLVSQVYMWWEVRDEEIDLSCPPPPPLSPHSLLLDGGGCGVVVGEVLFSLF